MDELEEIDDWDSDEEVQALDNNEDDDANQAADLEIISKKKKDKIHFGSYQTMGLLPNLQKAISRKGWKLPTPIQRKSIPHILSGEDVVAMARTGSGKTAAFLVPMFQKLKEHSERVGVRAIILNPSRELAMQTFKVVQQLGKFMNLRCILLVGGDSMEAQFNDFATNPDIIVATPGRLMHHLTEIGLSLKTVEYIVFDEADRLFEMGFSVQLKEILTRLPENRQTLLFSATLPSMLVEFAKAGLHNPRLIRLDTETKISDTLKLAFFMTNSDDKPAALLFLLQNVVKLQNQLSIIFTATRHHVEFLHELLRVAGIDSTVIYGSMDQTARKINITRFRQGTVKILIVTDVAARGIDVPMLDNVINYDFPSRSKLFVHRVGRAGRMGRIGTAYNLVSLDEIPYMMDLQLFLGRPFHNTAEGPVDESEIYYGKIPQVQLDQETEFITEKLGTNVDLQNMFHVVQNAYKLYYKTRNKPTPDGIKKAKEFDTNVNINPLLLQKFGGSAQAEAFLQGIKNYKPHQTIFEVDITKHSAAAAVMGVQRKFVDKLMLKKPPALQPQQDTEEEEMEEEEEQVEEAEAAEETTTIISKKRKRRGQSGTVCNFTINDLDAPKKQKKTSWKDENFFMESLPSNRFTEMGMSVNDDGGLAKEALDIAGDDETTMKKGKMMSKWDRKKKKFVKYDPNAENDLSMKKVRNEAGQLVFVKDKDKGKIYREWKEKHRMELQRVGDYENTALTNRVMSQNRWQHKHHKGENEDDNSNNIRSGPPRKIKDELKNRDQLAKDKRIQKWRENMQRRQSAKDQASGGKQGGFGKGGSGKGAGFKGGKSPSKGGSGKGGGFKGGKSPSKGGKGQGGFRGGKGKGGQGGKGGLRTSFKRKKH